jgi:ribosomal protein S18 acetylase RimI-like enzyme
VTDRLRHSLKQLTDRPDRSKTDGNHGRHEVITVRPATPSDAASLGRFGAMLVAAHHEFDPDRFMVATSGTERAYGDYLVGKSAQADVFVLVAEEAGAVLGYAYGGLEGNDYMALRGPAGVVYDLVVDPDRRRQGIGRKLLKKIVDTLAERGAPRIVLFTAERNQNAQRLFASAGFRPTMIEMTWEPPKKS